MGKTAWVTGGGTGIGAAGARALAQAGAQVVLSGRRAEPVERVARKIRDTGGSARALPVDVTDAAAMTAVAAEIGPVDILVAAAGLNKPDRALQDLTPADWHTVIRTNLDGVFHAVHAVLPGMRAAGDGQIILISSWAGRYVTRLTGAAYTASKHGVATLGETINLEEGPNGIRATVILPAEVATEILNARPIPPSPEQRDRMLQPGDLGETIRFVAEMPARACVNEILISPTWNRFYSGFDTP
ncbi:MAG: SDR family oxidoreductase [Marinibacterium sp.]